MKHLFIINPKAGKGKAITFIKEIKDYFKNKEEYFIETTEREGHATSLVREYVASNDYRVYSIGGDGTLNEVLNGIIGSNSSLAVIPAGTGNDFIKSIIENRNHKDILRRTIEGSEEFMDLGKINKKYFINIASIGFDAAVTQNARYLKQKPFLSGKLAYLLSIFLTMYKFKGIDVDILIDCKLYHLKNSQKPIENRQRLRLYHGTNEILCRVIILDKEEINPGEEAYVQLRLERPITVQRNDRYVLRTYSPMVTIAGGSIIEPVATKAKRFKEDYIKELKIKESGDPKDIVESTVLAISSKYPTEFDILKALGKNHEDIQDILKELIDKNKIINLNSSDKSVYIHKSYYENKLKELMDLLETYHNQNPLKVGMSKEEIKGKIFGKEIKQKTYDEILEIMQSDGSIKINDSFVALESFNMEYTKDQKEMKDRIIKAFKSSGYNSPKYSDMEAKEKDKKTFKMVYESLMDTGSLVKVMEDVVYLKEDYLKAKDIIKSYIEENESIGAAEARTILDTSRKYAVAILEHFDSIKFTKRIEDKRILY